MITQKAQAESGIAALNESAFDDLIRSSIEPVLVEFASPGGSNVQAPHTLEFVESVVHGFAKVARVHFAEQPALAARYDVNYETFAFFKHGVVVSRHLAPVPASHLTAEAVALA